MSDRRLAAQRFGPMARNVPRLSVFTDAGGRTHTVAAPDLRRAYLLYQRLVMPRFGIETTAIGLRADGPDDYRVSESGWFRPAMPIV